MRGTELVVRTDDGVDLRVEIDDHAAAAPAAAGVTVVFCHGYLLGRQSWCLQRAALRGFARLVLWDQRGHGGSGWSASTPMSIERLALDLAAVVDAVAPTGPVLLAGHSMGAMTILALARVRPDLVSDRLVGVLLCSTSAGRLRTVTVGLPAPAASVVHWAIPVSLGVLRRPAWAVDVLRRVAARPSMLASGPLLFAHPVPRWITALVTGMMAGTPIRTVAALWPAFLAFDAEPLLSAFDHLPVRVLVGTGDRITPVRHSAAIAAGIRDAELSVLPATGHLSILERPTQVTDQLRELLRLARSHHNWVA